MENIFLFLHQLLRNDYFILLVDIASFTLKTIIFLYLFILMAVRKKKNLSLFFVLITLFSAAFVDFGWILGLMNRVGHPIIVNPYRLFIMRLGWPFFVLQYQSTVLLLNSLIVKNFKTVLRKNVIFIVLSFLFALFFILLSFYSWNLTVKVARPLLEAPMRHLCSIYLLLILMPISLWRVFYDLRTQKIPIIIKKQCYILISYVVIPYLLSDLVNMNPIRTDYFAPLVTDQAFAGISALILTYLLYFCTRRILNIRFLHFKTRINSVFTNPQFNTYFKETLNALGMVNHVYEIAPVAGLFLTKALHIQSNKMHLFIRPSPQKEELLVQIKQEEKQYLHPVMATIESFLLGPIGNRLLTYLKSESIVVTHELDFVNFYQQDPFFNELLLLLTTIECAVLVPLFEKTELVGYMVIYDHARTEELYTDADKDALIVFANYLGTIISSIQHKKLELLSEQNSFLVHTLYAKNQYINQLKETISLFMPGKKSQRAALFVYKNNLFLPINSKYTELVPTNLNTDYDNAIVKACKQLVQTAIDKCSMQTTLINRNEQYPLLAIAVPHEDSKDVSLTITMPSVADLVGDHLDSSQSVDDWDYIMYLQTTKAGSLINSILPGWSKRLLAHKIDLLKKILNHKAVFIDTLNDDVSMLIDMVYQAVGRKNRFTVDIATFSAYETDIFGINPLYGGSEKPLLQSLHLGSLIIKNIDKMSIGAQEKLATYIRYGHFTRLKSNTFLSYDVHLILTSPFGSLSDATLYAPALRTILEEQRVILPFPDQLDEKEFLEMVDGYSAQIVASHNPLSMVTLSDYEKRMIRNNKISCLTDLKQKITSLVTDKNRSPVTTKEEVTFDAGSAMVEQTLADAARLGKNALKERHIMTILWYKFEKNQNKIAIFLGVNRSSVCRKVKEYNLL